jgi:hypothetical protein
MPVAIVLVDYVGVLLLLLLSEHVLGVLGLKSSRVKMLAHAHEIHEWTTLGVSLNGLEDLFGKLSYFGI